MKTLKELKARLLKAAKRASDRRDGTEKMEIAAAASLGASPHGTDLALAAAALLATGIDEVPEEQRDHLEGFAVAIIEGAVMRRMYEKTVAEAEKAKEGKKTDGDG